jgi:hypothetical protein
MHGPAASIAVYSYVQKYPSLQHGGTAVQRSCVGYTGLPACHPVTMIVWVANPLTVSFNGRWAGWLFTTVGLKHGLCWLSTAFAADLHQCTVMYCVVQPS